MPGTDPVRWFGHIARSRDGNTARIAWLIAEPALCAEQRPAMSLAAMADALGLSVRTISRTIGRLERERLLVIRADARRGRPRLYDLTLPTSAGGKA